MTATALPATTAERDSLALLAAAWVLAFYSNVPIYQAAFVSGIVQPIHWIALLTLASLLLLPRAPGGLAARPLGFPLVLTGYACLMLAWYVGQGGGDLGVLRLRMLALAVCGVCFLVFSATPSALLAARKAMVVVVLGSVAVNFYDITHPFKLVPPDSEFSFVGRAAGLFVNPNQAGAALVLGFALTISLVPPRWRIPYLVAVAAGVTLTLSRAALLGFVLVCIALTGTRAPLSWRQLFGAVAVGTALAVTIWSVVSAEIQERFQIDPAIVFERVLWILDPSGRADFSQEERLTLLERGLSLMLGSPFVGNGLGSTELWEMRASTHNVYVQLGADFGVLGAFVLPAIVVAAINGLPGRVREANVAGLFLLFWGVFSHNVLTEFYLLVGIAMIAALSRAPLASAGPRP
jgi:hypothetical protein